MNEMNKASEDLYYKNPTYDNKKPKESKVLIYNRCKYKFQ
jgi:hypothetical protein